MTNKIEQVPAEFKKLAEDFSKQGFITTSLDNLIKGSSGQALQNANIVFGLEETSGLMSSPFFP